MTATKKKISDIITSLDNKATGINSIPIKILKLAKEQIAEHLLCIIYIFYNRYFSRVFKIAKVASVYKESSKHECANYRPISLLPNLGKVI